MPHLPGNADEIRASVPPVLEAWEYMRDNVLRGGLVEPELKRLVFRYLAEDSDTMDFSRFEGRERLALEWAQAIAWDSDRADDALWEQLHAAFDEPELDELLQLADVVHVMRLGRLVREGWSGLFQPQRPRTSSSFTMHYRDARGSARGRLIRSDSRGRRG